MPDSENLSRFRVGIMCLSRVFPAWQAEAIRSMLAIPQVDISLLIVRDEPEGGPIQLLRGDSRHLIWNLYNKVFVQRRSAASRQVDLGGELGDVPEIRPTVIPIGTYAEGLSEEDITAIRDYELDVIVRFAFGILEGAILDTARYGVWSFHHGDERAYRGQPPGFWEMFEGEPVVGAILQKITDRLDAGIILHRGTFRATPHSYQRTRDEVLSGSADFASIAIRRIVSGDSAAVDASPSETEAPLRRSPDNRTMARFVLRQFLAFLKSQWIGMARASKWSVGFANSSVSNILESDLPALKWVPEQGKNRYLADPSPTPPVSRRSSWSRTTTTRHIAERYRRWTWMVIAWPVRSCSQGSTLRTRT